MPIKKNQYSFKRTTIGKLSYELRTPLNDIIGFSQLICSPKVGKLNSEQKEYLKYIITSSKSLLKLIDNLIELSKKHHKILNKHSTPVSKANIKKLKTKKR